MERKYVFSAFLDLRGFGLWVYRASVPPEIKEPFIRGYIEIFQKYFLRHQVHFKFIGDGFMAIREFEEKERKNGAIFEFINGLKCATKKIRLLINSCEKPVAGVRVRVTEGYAYKIMVIDPNDIEKKKMIPEYIEYGINTAQKLLEVNPEIPCVVTKGVADALGKYRQVFRSKPLGKPSCEPKGVHSEDLQDLQVLRF